MAYEKQFWEYPSSGNDAEEERLSRMIIRLKKSNAELLEVMEKYAHHWDIYFGSPAVGQPPDIQDLRNAISKAKGTV
jgi:hypothetical protein